MFPPTLSFESRTFFFEFVRIESHFLPSASHRFVVKSAFICKKKSRKAPTCGSVTTQLKPTATNYHSLSMLKLPWIIFIFKRFSHHLGTVSILSLVSFFFQIYFLWFASITCARWMRENCRENLWIVSLHFLFRFCIFAANSGLYAHYVFNTLDSDRSGIVSFEVSTAQSQYSILSSSWSNPLCACVRVCESDFDGYLINPLLWAFAHSTNAKLSCRNPFDVKCQCECECVVWHFGEKLFK